MDALTFWRRAGTPLTKEVCARSNVSFGYFKHLAHGRKTPSVQTALALAEISAKLTREHMTVLDLLGLSAVPPRLLQDRHDRKAKESAL